MSDLAVSHRTILRDAIVSVLEDRKKETSLCRVPAYQISTKWLGPNESKQAHTYCVVVSEETRDGGTQRQRDWKLEVKLICLANDSTDPHPVLDAMIEDAQEVMETVRTHAALQGILWDLSPEQITPDEATVEAGPWGQAVCSWMMRHRRS